ncbi:predicted protein [Lichtheimia corymbifera JMRC:FSU:9682]|uniref:Uncharacterized protein n=1 Tax=Lichtheimia corymbifera JMRC:FSU:9682 TaxID=1263082 RepID=A0A068SD41_9FUNG|nr:predicted protein [Lichtheimia corymbifera JMRC:FSU:9682]
MASPWRVLPTTATPAFLDTACSLVCSSATTNAFTALSLHYNTRSLAHSSPRPNVAAVAIMNVFYSIVSSYLQQLALIHTNYNG